jgi:thiosulfate reductase cytochrome b subunit
MPGGREGAGARAKVQAMARRKVETISGFRLPEPRITPMAIWLAVLWVGAPILVITGLLDLAMQVVFGVCTGVWCIAP